MIAYILNLLDLVCTLVVVRLGVREANPLMRSVPVMIFHKVVTVGALCWWLSGRPEMIAAIGLGACTVVYAGLAIYHCYGIFKILAHKSDD